MASSARLRPAKTDRLGEPGSENNDPRRTDHTALAVSFVAPLQDRPANYGSCDEFSKKSVENKTWKRRRRPYLASNACELSIETNS